LTICEAAAGAAGFGATAGGGVKAVEAGVDGAVASDALVGLTICGAPVGADGFCVSAGGGAELVAAGVGDAVASDGGVATGAFSGLTICGAAVSTAGFGVPAGCAESVRAGVDGAVATGAPSGPILTVGTGMAASFSSAGVNAGAADPEPEEPGCGASPSAFPLAGSEPTIAGAVPALDRGATAPTGEGAA